VSPGGSAPTLFSIETVATSEQAPRVLSLVGRLNLNGLVKQLSLDFRLDEDTCCEVADELVDAFQEGCPHLNATAVSTEIERAVMCSDYAAVKSPRLQMLRGEDSASEELSIAELELYQEMDALVILQERQLGDLARLHAVQSTKLLSRIGAPAATLRELVQQAVAENHPNTIDTSPQRSGSEGKSRSLPGSQEFEGPTIALFKEGRLAESSGSTRRASAPSSPVSLPVLIEGLALPKQDMFPAPEGQVSEPSDTSDIPMLSSLAGLLNGPPPPSEVIALPDSDTFPAPEGQVSGVSDTSDIPMLSSLAGLLDGPPPPVRRQITM